MNDVSSLLKAYKKLSLSIIIISMFLILILYVLPVAPQLLINGVFLGGLYALMALGLSLILGVLKIFNLIHGDLIVLGAYVSYWISILLRLNSSISLIIAPPILFIIGLLIQKGVLGRILKEEAEPILALFGLSLALQNLYIYLWTADARSVPSPIDFTYQLSGLSITFIKLITLVVSVVTAFIIHIILYYTDFGRRVRATAQNKDAAELVGINTAKIYAIIFGLGIALVGFSSFFVGILIPFEPTSGLLFFFKSLATVALAGMGSITGLIASGSLLGVVETVGGFILGGGFKDILTYGLLFVMLVIKPKGLLGRY